MAVMPDRGAKRDFVPLEPFVHQVGGHCSMMKFDDVSVCKPLKQREHRFYEEQPPEMRPFTPEYRGVVYVSFQEDKDGYIYLTAHQDKLALECQKKEGSTKFCITNSDNDGSSGEEEDELSLVKGPHRVRLQSGKLELVNTRLDGLFEAGDMPEHSSDMVSHGWPDSRNPTIQAVMPAGTALNGSAGANPWSLHCHKEQLNRMRELGPSSKTHKFIVLENVAHRFSSPCILDLKMGTRHHGDDAPSDKRERQIAKAEQSTSKTLGIRAGGMQVYNSGSGRFMCRNKYYGLKLCQDGFREELVTFLHSGEQFRTELIEPLLYKLRKLYKVIEKQNSYRFYSSSLLLMYEGDMKKKCNFEKEQETCRQKDNIGRSCSCCSLNKNGKLNSHCSCKVDVRMIDFAHTTYGVFAGDPMRNGPDTGYLFGLKNLIRLLEEIRDKYQDPTEVKTQESNIICDKNQEN